MVSRHEKELMKTFQSLTSCTDEGKAKRYLSANNWNINYALNEYYDKEVGGFTEDHMIRHQFKYPDELVSLFGHYAALIEEDGTQSITPDGLIDYIQDLGYNLEDLVTISLAHFLQCKNLENPITEKQFLYFWYNEGCYTLEQMRHYLEDCERKLCNDWKYFTTIYSYSFDLNASKQGVVETDIAIEYWKLFFEENRTKLSGIIKVDQAHLDLWCKFLQDEHKKLIHKDTWQMLLLFFKKFPSLDAIKTEYNEADAWPYTIDEFYEYLEERNVL